ncbi:MAG: pilus assembly protein PilM [Candidatus Omnitrophota bacterium]
MSRENFPEKTNDLKFVKGIFERNNKGSDASRKISALFGGTRTKAAFDANASRKRSSQKFLPLGLDASGENFIKAVRLFEMNGHLHLAGIASKRYSKDFKEALKGTYEDDNLRGEAVIGVSAKDVQIRVLSLPPMPSAEIESAIMWAIADALNVEPQKMDEFCIDYAVLSEEKSGMPRLKDKKVFVAVARKDIISKKIEEASEEGFNVIAVEPAPLALFAGLCYFSPPDSSASTLLLDIGEDQSSLSVGFGQDVYLVQNVEMTSNSITQAIKDYFQIDYENAENLKNKFGLQDWNSTPEALLKIPQKMGIEKLTSLRPVVASRLENLVVNIEHSYKLALAQSGNSSIGTLSRVIICGEGARIKGIDAFIRGRFFTPLDSKHLTGFTQSEKTSVEIFNPLESVIIGEEVKNALSAKEEGAAFATAIGLAMRGKECNEETKSDS